MTTKKTAAKKSHAKKAVAKNPKRQSNASGDQNYTKPELREKIKQQVLEGEKGGRPGQWSARKAQLLAHEYEAKGGGYKHSRSTAQRSLKAWGDEQWRTADGKQAVRSGETHRYLPDAAWKELSQGERKATDRKKVTASRRGKQFVANTAAAATARKRASRHKG